MLVRTVKEWPYNGDALRSVVCPPWMPQPSPSLLDEVQLYMREQALSKQGFLFLFLFSSPFERNAFFCLFFVRFFRGRKGTEEGGIGVFAVSNVMVDAPSAPIGCRTNNNADDSADAPNYDMEDSDDELEPLAVDGRDGDDALDDDDDDDDDGFGDSLGDDMDSPRRAAEGSFMM